MIDVVIPTFKLFATEGLSDVFKSQLAYFQGVHYVENVIVVSDWPEDNFLLEKEITQYSKVKFIKSKMNVGQAKVRNIGFSLTKSTYVIFLDQDDTLKFGNVNWGSDLIFFSTSIQSEKSVSKYFSFFLPFLISKVKTIDKLYPLMLSNIRVSPGSFGIRRSLFESIGGFPDLKSRGSDDYGLLVRAMMKKASIEYCRETQFYYKIHENQSRNILNLNHSIKEFINLDKDYLSPILRTVINFRLTWIGSLVGRFVAKIIAI